MSKSNLALDERTLDAQRASEIADRLGMIAALKADLTSEERLLKGDLVTMGINVAEGNFFRAVVVEAVRKTTNWKGIAQKLGASARMIRANTSENEVWQVRVSAKRGVE